MNMDISCAVEVVAAWLDGKNEACREAVAVIRNYIMETKNTAPNKLKVEIAALAAELEVLHAGEFDYGKGEIVIERMRQLSTV